LKADNHKPSFHKPSERCKKESEYELPQLAQAEHAIQCDIKNSNAAF